MKRLPILILIALMFIGCACAESIRGNKCNATKYEQFNTCLMLHSLPYTKMTDEEIINRCAEMYKGCYPF
jgi:hypothetical protein